MLQTLLITAYLLIWVVLFVDCVRRKEFYPLWGTNRITKLFWLVTFVFFNPVLTAAYFLFGIVKKPQPRVARWVTGVVVAFAVAGIFWKLNPGVFSTDKPFCLKRNPQTGIMAGEGIEREADTNISVTTVKTEQSIVFSSGISRFAITGVEASPSCSHVVILNADGHQLTRNICEVLADALGNCRLIDSIEYYPINAIPEIGSRTPDVVIRLVSGGVSSCSLPFYRSVSADVDVFAGDSFSSAVNYTDSSSDVPLVAGLDWQAAISHKSRALGYELFSRRYEYAARRIGEDIGEKLIEQFKKLYAEKGLLSDLPGDFYGEYQETPKTPFAERDDCRLVSSTAGFFHFNRSVWWLADDRETAVVLAEMHEQLIADGWEGAFDEQSDADNIKLHMHRGDERLVARRHNKPLSAGRQLVDESDVPPIGILYERSFRKQDRNNAIARLLDSGLTGSQIFRYHAFFVNCDPELRERFWALISRDMPPTVSGKLAVIQHNLDEGKNEVAETLLRNAAILARARHEYDDYKVRFEELAEKSGNPELVNPVLTPEVTGLVGFDEWADGETSEVHKIVRVNEPLLLMCRSKGEETIAVCARVVPDEDNESSDSFCLWCGRTDVARYSNRFESSRMSMVTGMSGYTASNFWGSGRVYWGDRFVVITAKSVDEEHFRISAKLADS